MTFSLANLDDAALTYKFPKCGAEPEYSCIFLVSGKPSRFTRSPHEERIALAASAKLTAIEKAASEKI